MNDPTYMATYEHSGNANQRPEYSLQTIFFKRSSEFSAQIFCEFHEDLNGLYSWYALLHTSIGKDAQAYNNWNFSSDPSSKWWDSVEHGFWYAQTTKLLVISSTYKIGQEQLSNALISVQPQKWIHKDCNITERFMGFATGFKDHIHGNVTW